MILQTYDTECSNGPVGARKPIGRGRWLSLFDLHEYASPARNRQGLCVELARKDSNNEREAEWHFWEAAGTNTQSRPES